MGKPGPPRESAHFKSAMKKFESMDPKKAAMNLGGAGRSIMSVCEDIVDKAKGNPKKIQELTEEYMKEAHGFNFVLKFINNQMRKANLEQLTKEELMAYFFNTLEHAKKKN